MEDKRTKFNTDKLMELSKEELVSSIQALSTQNQQLKNIIRKQDNSNSSLHQSKPFNFETCIFRHILIKFLYLGWNYNGYTIQDDSSETIEDYLFHALLKTCLIKSRSESNYHRCGRTDKGVSSFSQVISIDVRSKLTKENQSKLDEEIDYCLVLNKVLPNNIQCISWSPTNGEFSARFNCIGRTYKYFFPKGNLDVEKMKVASNYLLGVHDFRNFCKMDVGNGVTQFTRTITNIVFDLFDNSEFVNDFSMYVVTISGQAFLWHQIRNIMGILFLVGEGKEKPEVVAELLDITNNPRKPDYNMASEIPLNLYNCHYEDDSFSWQYSDDVRNKVLENLYKTYTFKAVQSSMIKAMIYDLQTSTDNKTPISFSQFLLQGVKPRVYTAVMKRQKCESLETKIIKLAKRKKLQS